MKKWVKLKDLKVGNNIVAYNGSSTELDEIVSIKECGTEDVYDLTIEKEGNFIAGRCFTHNTRW